jgi:hypothetical protein
MDTSLNAIVIAPSQSAGFLASKIPSISGSVIDPSIFQELVFQYAEAAWSEYPGGLWEFVSVSNGGFYMRPAYSSDRLSVIWPHNSYAGSMSSDALGLGICLMVLSHLSFRANGHPLNDNIIYAFHQLRDYALEHRECEEILTFID